jgi:serine/threonine-protein kinase
MTSQPLPFEKTSVSEQIPAQMRAAILRSLSKNREERQTSAQGFYDELAGSAAVPQPAGHVSSGTAAMAAPPTFGAGVSASARTAAMPAGGSAPTPGAMAAPAVVPLAPSGGGKAGGGGKGLVIGLVSVGAVLLVGIVVVAARSMKPPPDEPLAALTPTPSASPAKIEPVEVPAEPPEVPEPAPTAAPAEPETPPTATGATKPAGKGGAAGSTPPAAGAGGARPTSPTPTAPKPPAPTASGCDGCLSAAASGNFSSAASAYGSCSDPGKKMACAARVRGMAPAAALTAARLGDCAKAKSIAAAAMQMGIRVSGEVSKLCK